MFMMAGTIKNAVNLAQMDQKWQQKKAAPVKEEQKRELTVQERELQRYQENMEQIRESNRRVEIANKLKAGYTLTNEEITYLRRNDPEALKEYEEVKREREAYEKQLKNCRSKEETERLKLTKLNGFMAQTKEISTNPYIPKDKKIQLLEKLLKKEAGVQAVHRAFTETLRYQQLPEEEKDGRHSSAADEVLKQEPQENAAAEVQSPQPDEETSQPTEGGTIDLLL
ncbi:MAG: hypothetical protein J6B43_04790 [Lachnospiraceae bacterium]|nr:hypothetical protein [Lachnospiraceae bacterium]